MSKILVVFGATGNQGGSIARYVKADPVLSKQYTVRAVTRNTSQPAAKALAAEGIEVVEADLDGDAASIRNALKDAHTVFATTTTIYDGKITEHGIRQGRAVVDATVAAGAKYLIWSTLSSPLLESRGKYARVESFDSKYQIEQYIRSLPIKSAFFAPASFMQNFSTNMSPYPSPDGFTLTSVLRPESKLPLIDIEGDSGKFVGAILASPDTFEGKILSAATDFYSMNEIVQTLSRVSGKTVTYNQVPVEVFKGFLPPEMADCLSEMLLYIEEFGYYGSESSEKVAWTAEHARGRLTTLEEYFRNNLPAVLK